VRGGVFLRSGSVLSSRRLWGVVTEERCMIKGAGVFGVV
jgi:hypothetical protein